MPPPSGLSHRGNRLDTGPATRPPRYWTTAPHGLYDHAYRGMQADVYRERRGPGVDTDHGDWWHGRAEYAVDRVNPNGSEFQGAARELAVEVLVALLRAGLPPFDIEVAVDDEASGVTLETVSSWSTAVRVAWQQDPAAETQMSAERWNAQRSAMNQALRTILSVQEFRIEDGPLGAPPIVLGTTRPSPS